MLIKKVNLINARQAIVRYSPGIYLSMAIVFSSGIACFHRYQQEVNFTGKLLITELPKQHTLPENFSHEVQSCKTEMEISQRVRLKIRFFSEPDARWAELVQSGVSLRSGNLF